jgi:hypothetical protein
MPDYPHEGTMTGRVDDAGENFYEEGKSEPCTLYQGPMHAGGEDRVDISGYAGHQVTVSYVGRQEYDAWECDVGTGIG